jgi:hypothetical protein
MHFDESRPHDRELTVEIVCYNDLSVATAEDADPSITRHHPVAAPAAVLDAVPREIRIELPLALSFSFFCALARLSFSHPLPARNTTAKQSLPGNVVQCCPASLLLRNGSVVALSNFSPTFHSCSPSRETSIWRFFPTRLSGQPPASSRNPTHSGEIPLS